MRELGYTAVTTVLNSGNAVFCAAKAPSRKHAADIASAIESGLRVSVQVVVKSQAELAAVVGENPFASGR